MRVVLAKINQNCYLALKILILLDRELKVHTDIPHYKGKTQDTFGNNYTKDASLLLQCFIPL